MADKEQINDSLKNPNKNFNENYTHNKNQIIIDTNKYFLEVVDEGGGTVGYRVLHPERLLRDIIKQNKQLARKTQECEELKEELTTYKKLLDNPEFRVALTDVRTGEREVWRKLGRKTDRYRKALEEIEEIIKSSTKDFSHIDWEAKASHALTAVDKISDIINKAKGEEKCQ